MRDDREFTALAEQYMDMVYRVALNAVRCPADAEDVTQNVMTGKKHMDQLALDGCWEFSFTVLLTGVLLKNGGEVGSSGGHGKELDGGWFAWEYRWVMPVDTSQIAALQLGETVVKIG